MKITLIRSHTSDNVEPKYYKPFEQNPARCRVCSEACRDLSIAKGYFRFRCAKQRGMWHGSPGVQEDPRSVGRRSQRGWAPLSIFSRWFGARARTRDKAVSPLGRTHRRIALASRQKQSVNVHVHAETFIQPRSSAGTSHGEKKKGGDRRDRGCGRLNGSTTDERVRNASERLDVVRCIARQFFTLTRNRTTPRRLELWCWFLVGKVRKELGAQMQAT